MNGATTGVLQASQRATVDTNLDKFPRLTSPLLKKKLAPRSPCLHRDQATVREMVDFPVPALPFNQNIVFDLGLSIQQSISLSSSSRVFGKHVGLCSSA
jgi:hypothetical protein